MCAGGNRPESSSGRQTSIGTPFFPVVINVACGNSRLPTLLLERHLYETIGARKRETAQDVHKHQFQRSMVRHIAVEIAILRNGFFHRHHSQWQCRCRFLVGAVDEAVNESNSGKLGSPPGTGCGAKRRGGSPIQEFSLIPLQLSKIQFIHTFIVRAYKEGPPTAFALQ